MRYLRVALAQINTTVGDLDGNAERMRAEIARARDFGADIVCFPELAVTGYPPEDLILRRRFIDENIAVAHQLAQETKGIVAVYGFVDADDDIYNAAATAAGGRIIDTYHKHYLPNYGVFDEDRYFRAGRRAPVYEVAGVLVGVNICEDIWYPGGPTLIQGYSGAEVILNINASPFHSGKRAFREKMLATRASDNAVIVCYTNLVGGQDELVFDGNSMIFSERAELICQAPQFREELLVVDLDVEGVRESRLHDTRRRKERLQFLAGEKPERIPVSAGAPDATRRDATLPPCVAQPMDEVSEVYEALVLGTRDYLRKNGFCDVVIGLSGGIDSSLTACIAVDALGPEHVSGVSMPSRYSSEGSKSDAQVMAESLGIRYLSVPIEPVFAEFLDTLAPSFAETQPGLAEENLQARIRGTILMALSNKFGSLVLTTGNKSEMATGYSTLYGDMAGGFAVIKDVPKLLVYRLSEYRNRIGGAPIPRSVIEKPPSAELRPEQQDSDSLPPYEVLDPILKAYVEDDRALDEILALGYDQETVERVIGLVNKSEYKRRQAPPGIKITPRAFGRDRRLPIANRYRGY